MGQQLCDGPVHVAKIASAQGHGSDTGFAHASRQQRDFQPEVEATLFLIAWVEEIWQRRGIAFWTREGGGAKGSESFHRDHPWRQGGGKTLCEEWSQRLILPGLNVARRPVVHQADSENVLFCFADGDGFSQGIASAHKKAEFQFVIECLT